MSIGWNSKQKGFKKIDEAVKKAQKEGLLVVCAIEDKYYDYGILGLGKEPLANPDDINSYKPGSLWEKSFYNESNQLADKDKIGKNLMVPMDSICVASYTGNSDYMFYRIGGVS